jgi:hypothetical protein
MGKEQCPACGDYEGDSDFDPDVGEFYTCLSCGHRWHYATGVPKEGECWCECQVCANGSLHCESGAWCRATNKPSVTEDWGEPISCADSRRTS